MTEFEDTIRVMYNEWRIKLNYPFSTLDKEAFEAGWLASEHYLKDNLWRIPHDK